MKWKPHNWSSYAKNVVSYFPCLTTWAVYNNKKDQVYLHIYTYERKWKHTIDLPVPKM